MSAEVAGLLADLVGIVLYFWGNSKIRTIVAVDAGFSDLKFQ